MPEPRYTVLRVAARARARPFFCIYFHTFLIGHRGKIQNISGSANFYRLKCNRVISALMDMATRMKRLLKPKSVASIGVSPRTGENEFSSLENLLDYDYQGGFTL